MNEQEYAYAGEGSRCDGVLQASAGVLLQYLQAIIAYLLLSHVEVKKRSGSQCVAYAPTVQPSQTS
jgi:hypothetical protein